MLGWILGGELLLQIPPTTAICHVTLNDFQSQLNKFWDTEKGIPHAIHFTEEHSCEEHYRLNTHQEAGTDRYIIKLPVHVTIAELGNSHALAIKRFPTLKSSLNKNPSK